MQRYLRSHRISRTYFNRKAVWEVGAPDSKHIFSCFGSGLADCQQFVSQVNPRDRNEHCYTLKESKTAKTAVIWPLLSLVCWAERFCSVFSLLPSKKNTEYDTNIHKFRLKLMLSDVDFNKLSTAHTVCRTWSSFRCVAVQQRLWEWEERGTGRSPAGWSHLSCRRQRLPAACTEWMDENWKPQSHPIWQRWQEAHTRPA